MAMGSGKKNTMFTEINITPLTDIFLVLLIIMMVVAPTFQSMDNAIVMPEINSGSSVEQQNATVAVTKEGLIYLNGQRVEQSALTDALAELRPNLEKAEVVVKADEKTKSAIILEIMNSAKNAEYKKLIVAGEPLSKKDQKKLAEDELEQEVQG